MELGAPEGEAGAAPEAGFKAEPIEAEVVQLAAALPIQALGRVHMTTRRWADPSGDAKYASTGLRWRHCWDRMRTMSLRTAPTRTLPARMVLTLRTQMNKATHSF